MKTSFVLADEKRGIEDADLVTLATNLRFWRNEGEEIGGESLAGPHWITSGIQLNSE